MEDYKLGAVETRFARIIWQNAPLSSRELVQLCEEQLEWKKSTTYTVLKKLCQRGLFQNDGGMVTVLLTEEDFYARQSKQFVEDTFDGSLPAFIAAFVKQKSLSPSELEQIRSLIDTMKEG